MATYIGNTPEYPIEKFSWERSTATLSISRKDLNWPIAALPDKIKLRGNMALIEFYLNQLTREYRYHRTLEIYNQQEFNVNHPIMILTKVVIT